MERKTHIMETQHINSLAEKLNVLLSSYQVTYNNIRSAHWMIKGDNFFELHKFFETEYNDAALKADEIAERVLTLGAKPVQLLSRMIALSVVEEKEVSGDQSACVTLLLEDFKLLGELENEIVALANECDDVVTADIMTGYLRAQQKRIWMLSQFLSKRSAI